MTQPIPTRAQVVQALRFSGLEFLETLRKLPPEHFEKGCYEGGWNGRQVLAHVAAIEWTYPRLLEIPNQAPAPAAGRDLPTRTAG